MRSVARWLAFVGAQHLVLETLRAVIRTNQGAHARMVTSMQMDATREMDRYVARWGTEGVKTDA